MSDPPESPSNVERALAYLTTAFRKDYDTLADLVSEKYVWIDHTIGQAAATPEELRAAQEESESWSHEEHEIQHMMQTLDGAVITQLVVAATHSGLWRGIPATGRRTRVEYCNILRFDERGKVVAEESYYDACTHLRQIGAL